MRECPKCRTNEFNNRSMVMMINECGHPLCKICVENLFARNTGPCPQCGKTLWKKAFWEQVFDDPQIEKENHVRKKLKKIYNLKRDDFATLKEFNDYLERFETLVVNLSRGIDLEESEAEVARFKEENAHLIERNRKKLDEDQIWVRQMLDEERKMKQRASEGIASENPTEKLTEAKAKSIIEELKESDLPAEVILDRQRKKRIEAELAEKEEAARRKKKMKMEAQQKRTEVASFGPLRISGAPFVYRRPELQVNGPALPAVESLSSVGYLQHIRAPSSSRLAGGFTAETACMRALFDSRINLFAF